MDGSENYADSSTTCLPEGRLEIAVEPATPVADRSTPQLAMIVEAAT